jgi:hypothetical protein
MDSLGYTGFGILHKGEKWSALLPHRQRTREKEIEGEKREVLLTERGRGRAQTQGRWRVTTGEGRSPARESNRRETRAQRVMSLWLGLGLEAFFLKRDMGAPDSLQCLSGAHQTAHRRKDFQRAAAGALDIAQCSVWCTPDCPVSPDRGKIGKF